jgi:hypothetical protein
MKILFKTSNLVYKNKRQFVFYSIIDNQKKQHLALDLCKQILKPNYNLVPNRSRDIKYTYPELKQNDILLSYNNLKLQKFQEVITGKYFEEDYLKVFSPDHQHIHKNEKISLSKHIQELKISTIDPDYQNTYVYSNFKEFSNFILKLSKNQESKERVETFINCLCHIYLGNLIHKEIKSNRNYNELDEISKKTNFYILKGDYFFSLGYYNISKLGNSLLIKFYSKIAENFAISNFCLDISKIENKNYYNLFINYLVKKYISYVYYGCL